MNNTPEISVIVPVYKVEQYLPQCIGSILAQVFTDFELLLIDDGSPDCSGEICEKYALKDERIRVFHQKNSGVSISRNKGIEESKGKYIVFVDSDDFVYPKYLQELYDALPANAGRGLVIESVNKLYPDGSIVPCILPDINFSNVDKYQVLTDLVERNIGYSASKLYSRDLILEKHIIFIPTVSLLEDFFFMLDYIRYADFVLVRNISNYVYRVEFSEMAQSVCYKSLKEEYEIFQNYYSRILLYQKEYDLKSIELSKTWRELKIFFHRVLLSLYISPKKYSFFKRMSFIKKMILNYSDWVKSYYMPDYLVDRIGKFLLKYRILLFFDLWMRFLLAIHFKYMFGVKK